MMSKPNHSGFSLLELLLVLAIIGALTTISLPLYRQHLAQSERAQAQQGLLLLAQKMEQFQAVQQHYAMDGATLSQLTQSASENNPYSYSVLVHSDGTGYTLLATPKRPETQPSCGALLLDHRNVRGAAGVLDNRAALTRECWGS